MPHEADVRAWLARARVSPEDVDDVIQESYCRLAGLDSVDQIERPDAYFFSIARNLMTRRLKRSAVVPITTIAEIEAMDDERPSPEREVAGRLEHARLRRLLASLPDRYRRIVEMRRIEGRPQREVAEALGVTEAVVEWHVYDGVRRVVRAMRAEEAEAEARLGNAQEKRA